MNKREQIRLAFETALCEILSGAPVLDKEDNPLQRPDGTAVLATPTAADLGVIRAYLKDTEPPVRKEQPEAPKPGIPGDVLREYLAKNTSKLPFAIPPSIVKQ
jgi:hypothetical protein